jgi:hypothetical protein
VLEKDKFGSKRKKERKRVCGGKLAKMQKGKIKVTESA